MVEVLNCDIGRGCGNKRKKAVNRIFTSLKSNIPDICYIESPTGPMMHNRDFKLIKYLHNHNIPTGYFYRDCYRKFHDLFPRRKGFINSLKELYLDWWQLRTDAALKKVDIIYIPSLQGKRYFPPFKDVRALPPAGEDRLPKKKEFTHSLIYVGGISELYGFNILLESFEIVHTQILDAKLLCCCRKEDFENFDHRLKTANWLEIHHVSSTQLEPFYERAVAGLIAKRTDFVYNQIAVSVKLFEYLSYGLPIVTTSSAATDPLIIDNGIGIVTPSTPEGIANGIVAMLTDKVKYLEYCNNVKKTLLESDLWVHRVDQICDDLMSLNSKRAQ